MIRPGDIVLATVSQADDGVKLRPALVICQLPGPYGDWLVCGISSQLHQRVEGWDEILDPGLEDDSQTGLHRPSIVRLNFLSVVPGDTVVGAIGRVKPARLASVVGRLVALLTRSAA